MSQKYWEYFLSIEADLDNCQRYIAFERSNYLAYSNEFAKIIMAASAEVDNVFKDLCSIIDASKTPKNINQYCSIVTSRYPKITQMPIEISRYKISEVPWKGWNKNISPDWWKNGYNKIKHERTDNFSQANLKNSILSVGALFILILYYHETVFGRGISVDFSRHPKLFTPVKKGKEGMYWYMSPEI